MSTPCTLLKFEVDNRGPEWYSDFKVNIAISWCGLYWCFRILLVWDSHNNLHLVIIFFQIDVVVRYDLGPDQRDKFIREAKIMTGLHHEYIMKFYGAVILGPYAHSVGLVCWHVLLLFMFSEYRFWRLLLTSEVTGSKLERKILFRLKSQKKGARVV